MNDIAMEQGYGVLTEPATVKIERLLPGPAERIWSYLTDSELRRKWLASGLMEAKLGSSVELVWHNDDLTDPPGKRPPNFPADHRMEVTITACEPNRKLAISWGRSGGVTFELEPRGKDVLLTVIHSRLPDRESLLNVSAGWHAHLDILVDVLTGAKSGPFWDDWAALKESYEARIPG
ncbi:SRPBCC family protein [Aestuariivirga sp.]|uniref:SRPBCC family protein n=1 Tax=Aestuariivirga sp. TaxID=2650926 RepID=UPI0035942264